MRAVNLLPRDDAVRSFEAKRGVVFGAAGGAALVTVLLVTMTMSAGGAVGEKQSELDSLRLQLAAVPTPTPAEDTSATDALATEKGARVGALSAALADRVAWDRVLRQVSLVLPEDVWLTNLSATGGDSTTPTATGSEFILAGSTYSQNGVARLLSRLAVIPDLANVTLQSSQSALVNGRDLVTFTIFAALRGPSATGATS